jgi:Fic family protein
MRYNWQQPDWPEFRYDGDAVEASLVAFAERAGRSEGLLAGLPEGLDTETALDFLIDEAIESSAIEGESISRAEVLSSIRNHLGLNRPPASVRDRKAEGVGELLVAARRNFAAPLTEGTLFSWHLMLMKGSPGLPSGRWRTGRSPMQVVSGRIDRPAVHFEAPPSLEVPREMARFLSWFNRTAPGGAAPIHHAPVRSGLAHLCFETIHPFEDGNGRIGRVIAEKALSQGLGRPVLLSLSRTIERQRRDYYRALEFVQQSNEVTPWLRYWTGLVLHAQADAERRIRFVLEKIRFLARFESRLNERQRKAILRMFGAEPDGFQGGMNARKYRAITKTSKATATRDLQHLASIGALVPAGSGRATRYELP